jgi:hypothetical protein
MPASTAAPTNFSFLPRRPDGTRSWSRRAAIAVGIGVLVVGLAFDPFGNATLLLLVPTLVVLTVLGAIYTTRHHEWLFFVLLMIEVMTSASSIPTDWNSGTRYGLEFLFCAPVLPAFVRSGVWREGGFRLFLVYLAWGLITASYSLAPSYSVGRAINTFLLFSAIALCASEVNSQEDFNRLIARGVLACVIITLLLGISRFVMASDIIWQSDDVVNDLGRVIYSGAGGMLRFQGFLSQPNEVGETMLTTVGLILVYWSAATSHTKALLGCVVVLAFTLMVLADSRTSTAGIVLGCFGYTIWKHGLRGLMISLAVACVLLVGMALAGHGAQGYVDRGDVGSFTGRSDIWDFTLSRIKENPLFGYGYQVEGTILGSKYFPLWYGPWDDGPHSSLHENYLSRAAGVGVPAALLWVFIMLRPWVSLFRHKRDPLGLARLAFFAALPVFILGFAESSAADCRYSVGLLLMMAWALAERQRLGLVQREPIPIPRNAPGPVLLRMAAR